MSRRDFLIKWLLYAAATLIFILLQSMVLTHIHILHIHPFLLPVLAAMVAVWEPQREGVMFCLLLGLLCDLTMPMTLPCFYTLAFLLSGLLVSFIALKFIMPGFWCTMLAAALSLLVTDILNLLCLTYLHGVSFLAFLSLTGRELLLTLPLAPLVYLPYHWIYRRTRGL